MTSEADAISDEVTGHGLRLFLMCSKEECQTTCTKHFENPFLQADDPASLAFWPDKILTREHSSLIQSQQLNICSKLADSIQSDFSCKCASDQQVTPLSQQAEPAAGQMLKCYVCVSPSSPSLDRKPISCCALKSFTAK